MHTTKSFKLTTTFHRSIGTRRRSLHLPGCSTSSRPSNPTPVLHFARLMSSIPSAQQPSDSSPVFDFPVSPIPSDLGKCIKTAACLIIGDEILNGKTLDRNSNFFARWSFEHGILLKKVEVIADDEEEIIEASRRLVRSYDFVVTSGGIGPTHDDITYASLAKAFNQEQAHHQETLSRMAEMLKHRPWTSTQTAEQRTATQRMALFPKDAEVLFVGSDLWVPVVRLENKLCIFPGIPSLFQRLLTGLTPYLPLPPHQERPVRLQVYTKRAESIIAPYLTDLQTRAKMFDITIGSYPVLRTTPVQSNTNTPISGGVYISLIGPGLHSSQLHKFAKEVETEVEGSLCTNEEVVKQKGGEWVVESKLVEAVSPKTQRDATREEQDRKAKL